MCARLGKGWSLFGAFALFGFVVPCAAYAAEVPPAPPVASAQPDLPCTAAAELAPHHSAVHVGNFDVHFNMAGGAGQPLHVGLGLTLVQPLKHRGAYGEIPALAARGSGCVRGAQRGAPRPFEAGPA
jgi:hypothetical protein